MKIGLIDVDGHNFPNLPLMKIAAFHKSIGDEVEMYWGWSKYDRVYMSKIFDDTYTPDVPEPVNAELIIKGGTGYFRRKKDGDAEVFSDSKWTSIGAGIGTESYWYSGSAIYWEALPDEMEKCYGRRRRQIPAVCIRYTALCVAH